MTVQPLANGERGRGVPAEKNPNLESNPKQIRNQNKKFKGVSGIDFFFFGFRVCSDFDIRISDLRLGRVRVG